MISPRLVPDAEGSRVLTMDAEREGYITAVITFHAGVKNDNRTQHRLLKYPWVVAIELDGDWDKLGLILHNPPEDYRDALSRYGNVSELQA